MEPPKSEVSFCKYRWETLYEELLHVFTYAIFQRIETVAVTGISQLFHICLSKILVLFTNIFRHINEADISFEIQCGECGAHKVRKSSGLAGAQVIQS